MRLSFSLLALLALLLTAACSGTSAAPSTQQSTPLPPNNAPAQSPVPNAQSPEPPTTADEPAPPPTNTPIPSPTPQAAQLIQIMDGTCCASPGWYSDSETVLFIDKPSPDAPVGMYGININEPLVSKLWNERPATAKKSVFRTEDAT
jgi:hypothetical protein